MRIAIFTDNFYPELSGISDSVIALAIELAKRGHFVDFFAPRYAEKDYKAANVPFRELMLDPNIRIHRFASLPFRTGTGQGRFVIPTGLRTAAVRACAPDIIHTQQFFGVGVEGLLAAHRLGKPLVGTNHTAIKEFLMYSPIRTEWTDSLILKYVNWYYERCDLVTAPSHSVFDEMILLGFNQPNQQVISNPIDTQTFHPIAEKDPLKKKFGFGKATMFHAGRISEERHPDVLVKALAIIKKSVPDAELAFAGRGAQEGSLRELAKSLGIESSVKFLGFLDKQSLVEAYNAAELFGIASTGDTQSLVMMQAMACGIPVIGVRARALPEYINDLNGFIVEPGDEKAFAEKAIYLFTHADASKTLGQGGRTYAERFSAPAIAEEWELIYESVIKSYNERIHHETQLRHSGV